MKQWCLYFHSSLPFCCCYCCFFSCFFLKIIHSKQRYNWSYYHLSSEGEKRRRTFSSIGERPTTQIQVAAGKPGQNRLNPNNVVTPPPVSLSGTKSLVTTSSSDIYIYIAQPLHCSESAQPLHWSQMEKNKRKNKQLHSQQIGDHSRLSQRRGLRHIALFLKLKDRRSTEFLAFIRPVVYTGSDLLRPFCRCKRRGFHCC